MLSLHRLDGKACLNKITTEVIKMQEYRQMSEKYITGIILSMVGGFLDTYTYVCRDQVFANAQTGNLILLGVRCADRDWKNALYYLFPICSFAFGVILAEMIKRRYKLNSSLHWRQIIIAMEIVTLLIVSMIPQGNLNALANILVSFVCSLQVESFRTVNGHAFATTMCTGNLRSATERLYQYVQDKKKDTLINSLQYYGIILFFVLGAVLGTILTNLFSVKGVLFSCIGLAIVLLLMFKKE